MSVYGEYGRALETLIDVIRATDFSDRDALLANLVDARAHGNGDLDRGARRALEALEQLENSMSEPVSSATSPNAVRGKLDAARDHLRAHCRAVLGI